MFWAEKTTQAKARRWEILWLIWRITVGPGLLGYKAQGRYIQKVKSTVSRHQARKHRLYPINNEYHSSISNRGEGGGSKRWDVASFKFLENGFEGERPEAKRPVTKLWQNSRPDEM